MSKIKVRIFIYVNLFFAAWGAESNLYLNQVFLRISQIEVVTLYCLYYSKFFIKQC